MILAGDIGGTKTNVALFEEAPDRLNAPICLHSFASQEFASLEEIVRQYVAGQDAKISMACFGVAGPVLENRAETANLPWQIDSNLLKHTIGIDCVSLINDLEATAYGLEELCEEQFYVLNEGIVREGDRALIAAGTGLGTASIFWDGRRYRPRPSEGGHIDFAPRDQLEIKLFEYLSSKYRGHVSCERVLSGPGLLNIYSFLRDNHFAAEPDWLAVDIAAGNAPAAIAKAALSGESELAVKALDMLVEIYGAVAGNLALVLKAVAGVYIGGGVAPKIIDKLKDGTFMRGFKDKGRMSSFVASIPVWVILDDKTALYGAARHALENP